MSAFPPKADIRAKNDITRLGEININLLQLVSFVKIYLCRHPVAGLVATVCNNSGRNRQKSALLLLTENPRVGGSIPPLGTILFNDLEEIVWLLKIDEQPMSNHRDSAARRYAKES